MRINRKKSFVVLALLIASITVSKINSQSAGTENILKVTIDQCIELTLQNNNSINTNNYSEKIAEAKLKQAQSGYFPSLDLSAAYIRIDQDPNYVVPEFRIQIPAISLGNFSIPALTMPVSQQDIKLADKQNLQTDLNLVWPLFTGGKISSYVNQAETGIAIAKNDSKINEDQIIYDARKLYYSVILATKLEEIAKETLDRLDATLSVTESLFQNGSGRITKTDYLKNKLMVEAINTLYIQICGERKSAVAALINTMGLDWQTRIELTDNEIPFSINNLPLEDILANMFEANPIFLKIDNALNIYQYKIDEVKSDYLPTIAVIGGYHKIFNNYDYGIVTKQNKNVWMVGVGMKMNIFNGMRTSALIDENTAEFNKLTQQKEFVKKGMTLKLQYVYQKMTTAALKENSSKGAVQSAIENRELIEKAYFNDIMDLQDLMQAQLTEAFFKAQYQMVLFEHADYRAQLDNLLSRNN